MAVSEFRVEKVRASRAGHTFHERWAARRALQLVFPRDNLHAIAIEGLSSNEPNTFSDEAEDIADLILYYGSGDTFKTCDNLQTLQFKYKTTPEPATSSYLKKTIQKFAHTTLDYEKESSAAIVDEKLSFAFVTNGEFSDQLWQAIECLQMNKTPKEKDVKNQFKYLKTWCQEKGVDAHRLFRKINFQASTRDLLGQNRLLSKTVSDWGGGNDGQARARLFTLTELVREKAGLTGQRNNLIKREEILDALGCDVDDLFPADTRFVSVKNIVKRSSLKNTIKKIKEAEYPIFLHADGGVGKTVFIQDLANHLTNEFEAVIFDCFGGGAYRSEDQARHLPKVGLVQIVNELASRGLCDPLLPSDSDRYGLIKATRKRLTQAICTLKKQSSKSGLLVVLDAADNAQLEANRRKEDSFPRLLLASLSREPIAGVALLLTARPHRMEDVIDGAKVNRIELEAFTDEETKAFLNSRRQNISAIELSTAMARSGGNARVLEYLVESWDQNIVKNKSMSVISVEQLIAQRCDEIFADLHIVGWTDVDIREFFAAVSLLPPPIPLDELATALNWSKSQVRSAASDLAPMLEIVRDGAIFRDEPTETYINKTYANESVAQQAIAQRLHDNQKSSMYAAEALPHLLVVINDIERAYDLANSSQFPNSIQTQYGRRRLKLARLYAAFILAVNQNDLDRVLSLSMQLAQIASANAKGDNFIRSAPAIASVLGDRDTSRRLFNDRTGWRGARDARLAIAYGFMGDIEEAKIYQGRAIGWINFKYRNRDDDDNVSRSGPENEDFASVIFVSLLNGDNETAIRNLKSWNFEFALSVSDKIVQLCKQHSILKGSETFSNIIEFSATKECQSIALQVAILSNDITIYKKEFKSVAKAASSLCSSKGPKGLNEDFSPDRPLQSTIAKAALTAKILNSNLSALRLMKLVKHERPSKYDYTERYGIHKSWGKILSSCVKMWAQNKKIEYHHLLPKEVNLNKNTNKIKSKTDLNLFLRNLTTTKQKKDGRKAKEQKFLEKQFNSNECESIPAAMEVALNLLRPLESSIFMKKTNWQSCLAGFLKIWEQELSNSRHWDLERNRDTFCRYIGTKITKIYLQFSETVTVQSANKIIELINNEGFSIPDKIAILTLLSNHENLHTIVGQSAKALSEEIKKDEDIEQRGQHHLDIATALLVMSKEEAREYYAKGLAELDQMGGEDYDLVYAMLRFAAHQDGGHINPILAHRFMNLCQTIFHFEPSKFGWTLFAKAMAKSVGTSALYKLVRWSDQDVADYSYSMPQLACFLTKNTILDGRRAALLIMLCKDHGWHDWKLGEGLKDIISTVSSNDQKNIFHIIFNKLQADHTFGGWDGLWKSLLECIESSPDIAGNAVIKKLESLQKEARLKTDEDNNRRNNSTNYSFSEDKVTKIKEEQDRKSEIENIASKCNLTSSLSIDQALQELNSRTDLGYGSRKSLFDYLRTNCNYNQQVAFTFALCETSELEFDYTLDEIIKNFDIWAESSQHLKNRSKEFISRIFEHKGSELFGIKYPNIGRQFYLLEQLCGDPKFVINTALQTIAKEQIELCGEEWIDLAISLCAHTKPLTSKTALEDLLSGAAKIGDEIGEGAFQSTFEGAKTESALIADILWHFLGAEDSFVRWTAAKTIMSLADLGLFEDIEVLFSKFDKITVPSLQSENNTLAFQNSQQWFLMGLSRATLRHKKKFDFLKDKLWLLAERTDLHVINKIHIARCLTNILGSKKANTRIIDLWNSIEKPKHNHIVVEGYPDHVAAKIDFNFDYDFLKNKVSSLARIFNIADNEANDLIAQEIMFRWSNVKSMKDFPDRVRHYGHNVGRYENYCEHIQRHAYISAATTLASLRPVARRSYDSDLFLPWNEWLSGHDVSFNDGTWLSDNKDAVPAEARNFLLTRKIDNIEKIEPPEISFPKIGFHTDNSHKWIPIYGSWKSKDSVHVRITSALAVPRGIIGKCQTFSKEPDHKVWLPMYDSDGLLDHFHEPNLFEPFLWLPERHVVGIDEWDELAANCAAARPRIGKPLINDLNLVPDKNHRNWKDENGNIVLKSQVWGEYVPDIDQRRYVMQDDGQLLWASKNWLEQKLSFLKKRLVYQLDLTKYKSRNSYSNVSGARACYIGLHIDQKPLRIWHAKNASRELY